jgi:alkyl sulfatase BDS1-like metallo-beta-lactamase superfamily hydrolase
VFEESLTLDLGGEAVELRHGRGETDDHLWAWFPERRLLCAGDFFIWNFPNAGNPQKVQRYPLEWAAALREMAAVGPELFVPAHGLPIGGRDRIVSVLEAVAGVLEVLVADTVALMNEGAPLDRIVHEVRVPAESLARPFLVPRYDEPEFVVRNIWRLYGGWYDGNPAHLKPAPQPAVSRELASLAGGAGALAARAAELAGGDDPEGLRLACHLVEHAVQAAPDDPDIHRVRAEVYRARRTTETSLMARGIYGAAAEDSEARLPDEPGG